MADVYFEPQMQLRPSLIMTYAIPHRSLVYKRNIKLLGADVRKNAKDLSRKSRSRMRNAIELLAYTATWKRVFSKASKKYFWYKLNFITLTLPSRQVHSDNDVLQYCLYPFLKAWAKRRPGLLYVVKCEVQDNDNIHFHITSNAFFHYKKLRDNWNKYTEKLSYVTNSGITDPNSTDVHSVKNIKNIALYLTSYFTKKDLYKKPLKRYFRIYGERIKKLQEPVFHLPKNYFKQLKRRLNCVNWTASKPLLNSKCVFNPETGIAASDIANVFSDRANWIDTDFVRLYPLKQEGLKGYPGLHKVFTERFGEVVRRQYEIDKYEEVEDF